MKKKLTNDEKLKYMAGISIECGKLIKPVYGFENQEIIGFLVTDEKLNIRELKRCKNLKS